MWNCKWHLAIMRLHGYSYNFRRTFNGLLNNLNCYSLCTPMSAFITVDGCLHSPVHRFTQWSVKVHHTDCCCLILPWTGVLPRSSWLHHNWKVNFSIQYFKHVVSTNYLSWIEFEHEALIFRDSESPYCHKHSFINCWVDERGPWTCREACISFFLEKFC